MIVSQIKFLTSTKFDQEVSSVKFTFEMIMMKNLF